MKGATRSQAIARGGFTILDHLFVQMGIERRAYTLWQSGGCRADTALSDWLCAEREVLTEFCRAHERHRRVHPFRRPANGAARAIRFPNHTFRPLPECPAMNHSNKPSENLETYER